MEQITNAAYHILGLRTFFTGGPDEVRAWTFHDGYTAPQCAGIIHTDMEAGFIKAEVYSFDDIDKYGTEESLRAQGLMRTEGKEYVVKMEIVSSSSSLLLRKASKVSDSSYRFGISRDIHRLKEGTGFILCSTFIPCDKWLRLIQMVM